MPTNKQRELVKNKLTATNSTDSDLVRQSGYSESMARQQSRVTHSKGVQELLAEASEDSKWLNPQGIKKCIEKAVKKEFNQARADTILRFYQLQVQAQPKHIETKNLNINITNKDIETEAITMVNKLLLDRVFLIKDNQVVRK